MLNHIGIIMDGNRRWAKSKFLPVFAGHKAGADNVVKITEYTDSIGIKYLTLWVLSTDNLKKRGEEEVKHILKLINGIVKYIGKMNVDNLRFETIGDLSKLPIESQKLLNGIKEETKNNTGLTLILGLIYGGQDEIVRATKKIINSGLEPEKLTKEEFRKYTDTGRFPVVDLIIRTGGDIRHSGFMLYDSEYSEYYFTEKKWPEFDEKELDLALKSFNSSKRNFGK